MHRRSGFRITDPADLGPAIDTLRELRLEGTLRAPIGLWNDYRVLSSERSAPGAVLDRASVARELDTEARWFGLATLQAPSEEQGVASVRRIERVLAPVVDELLVESRSGEPVSGRELFPATHGGSCFFQGIPHAESIRSVYFKKPGGALDDPDPDRDRCGVLWLCPTLPARGNDCVAAVEIAERVCSEHGFEPLLALIVGSDRSASFVPMLVYDCELDGEDERAMRCHDALLSELTGAGYPPRRLGIQSMGALPDARDDSASVFARLKRALDPDGLLAPGRYDLGSQTPARKS